MRLICCLLWLLVCVGMPSCMNVKELQVKSLKQFKVNQINSDGIDSELFLEIENPNRFSFYILPSEFDVKYSGVFLGQAKLLNKVKIKGSVTETYSFVLKNDFKGLNLMEILNLLSGSSFKNELEIKGDLKASKFLLRKTFPVNFKEKVGLN